MKKAACHIANCPRSLTASKAYKRARLGLGDYMLVSGNRQLPL